MVGSKGRREHGRKAAENGQKFGGKFHAKRSSGIMTVCTLVRE
ncbi:hypothetical protein GRAN_2256 [Granulicella sibirica]|uniref:Uncharacterized protein n=1 Tax=Granulicella sibirica TaxID=2479048 RepID=A0A4Q0TAY7_9BACT|nr:hypothetical protein GRAN_2256 [Granulicella sibirica]